MKTRWMVPLLLLAGCGVVPRISPHAALSPTAPEGRPAALTTALDGDPPLPGERRAGWEALDEGAADPARPLDADAAVRLALLNNRALRATLREVGVARGMLQQAGVLPNPLVEIEVLPERQSALELRVEYDLTTALLAPARSKVARAELEAARARAAGAVVQLGYEVRAAFYALQSAEQRLGIAQRALEAQAAGRDAARALVEAGNVPALDARTAEAAYERARIAVAQLELERAERREALQRLLGLHGDETSWTIVPALKPVPPTVPVIARPEERALEASLELRETRHQLEAASRRIGLTRAQGWLPDLSVDVHTLYTPHPDSPTTPSWTVAGGVSLTLPIFDRRQGLVAAQRAQLDALAARAEGTAVDLRSAAREARNRLVSAHARARHMQEVVLPAQRRVSEETQLQYNAMQLGVFQLLQARRDQLDVELAAVETAREFWTAQAALEALAAGHRVGAVAPAAMPSRVERGEGGH